MTWFKESVETAKEILNNGKEDLLIFETKSRIYRKIRDIVTRSGNCDKNIKTWGIMTASNPMGNTYEPEENKKRNDEFRKLLIDSHFVYYMIDGYFDGNEEKSFFIPNVSEDDMIRFASRYGQFSFIFGYLYREASGTLMCEMTYWVTTADREEREKYKSPEYKGKRDKRGNVIPLEYKVNDKGTEYDIDTDEKIEEYSFVTNHGREFKFIIPFECLRETIEEANEKLERLFEGKDRKRIDEFLIQTTIEGKEYIGSAKWQWRGYLYS